MVVALIALFVALSGASYAALAKNSVGTKQIEKNGVGASEIKSNAVRTAEIRADAVGTSEVDDASITGIDVEDESLGSPDVDGIGSNDVTDGSLNTADVQDESIVSDDVSGLSNGDLGVGESTSAFARIQADGTLQPNVDGFTPQVKGVDAEDVVKGEGGAATGTYCFGGLAFQLSSAQVTLDNADAAAADRNLVASVAIDRGQDLGDCPATHNQARVRIVDGNTEAAQDARFFIWFMR